MSPRYRKTAAFVLAEVLLIIGTTILLSRGLRGKPAGVLQPDESQPAARLVIKPKPASERQPGTDHFGDPLPEGAIARLGTVCFRARGIPLVAYSPDGTVLASGDWSGHIVLWNATTGQELRRFLGHQGGVHTIAFSPNGSRLASMGHDGVIRIWDATGAKELHRFEESQAGCLAFSPDGKTVASGGVGMAIHIWDLTSGKELRRLHGPEAEVNSIAFSPDGQTLAAASADRMIHLWRVSSGEPLQGLFCGATYAHKILWLPDSKTVVSASNDGAIRLWNAVGGEELRRLGQPAGDQLRSDQRTKEESAKLPEIAIKLRNIHDLVCSRDGKTLISSSRDEHNIVVWDVETGQALRVLSGNIGYANHLALSPDEKTLAAGCDDSSIAFWDMATGEFVCPIESFQSQVSVARFSPDGKSLATGGKDCIIHLWDTTQWDETHQLAGHEGYLFSLAFAAEGNVLASMGDDRTVRLWDPTTGKELRQIQTETTGWVHSVAISPEGRFLAASGRVYEVESGKERNWFQFQGESVGRQMFSPNGKILAIATGAAIRLCEPLTGKVLRRLTGQPANFYSSPSLEFSADGQRLVSAGGNGFVYLWEVATGKQRLFTGHEKAVYRVALTPDARMIAAVDMERSNVPNDNSVHLWEVATGQERHRFEGHRDTVYCLAFSPDGKRLVSASQDTTALVWDVLGQLGNEPSSVPLSSEQMETLWTDLASADAGRAYRAVCTLIARPDQALPMLREHLRPVPTSASPDVARWVADLNSRLHSEREQAQQTLEKRGEEAEWHLRRSLAAQPSLEVRKRSEQLLAGLDGPVLAPGRLRNVRALEVLEHIGTAAARQIIETMAGGYPASRLTQEAQDSLERLRKRTP